MMQERWFYAHPNQKVIAEQVETFGISKLLATILVARNIGNGVHEDIQDFITPPQSLVRDYTHLSQEKELQAAFKRVKQAIANKDSVLINGDPDADGISGTTVLVAGLRELGLDVHYDFPIRSKEGHGIQPRIIENATKLGCNLIISADCGSKDIETIEYATEQEIDVIITDHHVLGKTWPKALAMINPHTIKERNPMHSLSGSVVCLKFIIALFDYLNKEINESLFNFIIGIGTLGMISDRMSFLEPMNRAIALQGVTAINATKWAGISALKDICCPKTSVIKSRDLSRNIVPRLNAPGRIGNPEEGIPDSNMAVDLLLLKEQHHHSKLARTLAKKVMDMDLSNASNARTKAGEVDSINERRKQITSQIEDEIEQLIEHEVDAENDRVIIIKGENWNSGVIGIDTDRLKERFLRPAIIFSSTTSSDFLRASVRSIPTIDMYSIIDEIGEEFREENDRPLYCSEIETRSGKRMVFSFGGHAQACGFTIQKKDFDDFSKRIRQKMAALPPTSFRYSYEILGELSFHEVNRKLIEELDQLMPYGQRFEFPVFTMKSVTLFQHKAFGNKYQKARTPNVEFFVGHEKAGKDNQLIAVGFGLYEKYQQLVLANDKTKSFNIIFYPELIARRYKGKTRSRIRLNVLDIRKNEPRKKHKPK